MNEKLNNEERKAWARMVYTRQDETIKDIALTVGTEESTVRKWMNEGGWEGIKRTLLTSKAAQLEHLYKILEVLNNKISEADDVNPKDVDLLLKYTATIKNLETETSVAEIIEVFELFVRWMKRKDPVLTKTLVTHLDAYIKHKTANDSKT